MNEEAPALRAMQGAAREMIRSARTMLDAMEELVEDPDAVATMVGSLGKVAREVVQFVEGAASGRAAAPEAADRADTEDDIEHIRLD